MKGTVIPVLLYYSPYLHRTRLFIRGREYTEKTNRVGEYILGRSMDEWLHPCRSAYLAWNGFFPELVVLLNDDRIRFAFYGSAEDYAKVREAFAQQRETMEQIGYSCAQCSVEYRPYYQPKPILDEFALFLTKQKRLAPSQFSMMAVDRMIRTVDNSPNTQDGVLQTYQRVKDIIDIYSKEPDSCPESYWAQLREDWDKVFEEIATRCDDAPETDTEILHEQ